MRKKLTIMVDQEVYDGLYRIAGQRKISQYIERLVRPHVVGADLEGAYAELAGDADREKSALEWISSSNQ